jgi:two-component sensor histidine kinase
MRRRLAAVTLTALLPALGMLGYNEFKVRQERHDEVHEQAIRASQQVALELETVLEGVRGLLVATAAIPALTAGQGGDCHEALLAVSEKLGAFVGNIIVLDEKGRLTCDTLNWQPGTDFSDRDYIMSAMTSDDVVVGGYTIARVSSQPIVPVAFRLTRDGNTVGVIATGLRLSWLQQRITARTIPEGASVTIADRQGVVIARNPHPDSFVGTTIPERYRYLVTAAAPGSLEVTSQDGTVRILGYQPITAHNPLYASVGISKDRALAPVNRATVTGILMMLAGILLAFMAASLVGRRVILEPIQNIVEVVGRWREGDNSARTRMEGSHGELGLVGAAVDGLLDEIEVRRQASVAADEKRRLMARELSHRVKNTLSVIQAIVRQTFRGQDQQIVSFQRRVAALAGGYDALLSDDWNNASIREVAERVMQPLRAEDDGTITLSGPHCLLQPDVAVALSLVLHELGTNALKYGCLSVPEGRLSISWVEENTRLSLTWRERGGPPVTVPAREGFGSKLIRLAFPVAYDPEVTSDFAAEGLEFKLSFRMSPQIEADKAAAS